MSVALSAERDRIQREVEELERNLSVSQRELELLSSETDDGSDSEDTRREEMPVGQSSGLLAEREKLQKEIQNLEEELGDYGPVSDSDEDGHSSESDLGLSPSVDSCLQINLVYQQVIQETLEQLQTLLTQNYKQQRELTSQLSGPIRESPRVPNTRPSYQQPITMYLGHFLKPYFKDKLTSLGPPANQEAKGRSSRMTGCLEENKFKVKRWQSWQRSLLIHCVSKDCLKKKIQPKLSKLDFLSLRLSSAAKTDKQQLLDQINTLEQDIDLLRGKNEEEMIGDRYEDHDWEKISNIDFEGLREAEDIRCFWVNFLHPSINKSPWQPEEMLQLEAVAKTHNHRHWDSIAEELGTGRTGFVCLQMFQRFLSTSLRRSVWTKPEDKLLKDLVERMRIGNFIPYTQISYFMEGRQPNQVIYRWNQVLDPQLKKGPWSAEEDDLLLQAVSRHGEKNWFMIRLEVPGRTDCSCRDRYLDCLKVGIKKGAFDSEENNLLLLLVKKHGVGRWSKISAEIPQRNDSQCLRAWRALRRIQARGERRRPTSKRRRKSVARMKVEEEEEKSIEEEEEEEEEVEYMDSSEEETVKEEVTEDEKEEEEEEEKEEDYCVPPMKAWLPAEQPPPLRGLTFRRVPPPAPAEVGGQRSIRYTLVGEGGVTPLWADPAELGPAEPGGRPYLFMATQQQLYSHARRLFRSLRTNKRGRRFGSGRTSDASLNFQLQAAVTPWIGNLLLSERRRRLVSDCVREESDTRASSETLLHKTMLSVMTSQTKPMTSPTTPMTSQTNPMMSQTKLMTSPRTSQIILMTSPAKLKRMTSQTIPMTSQVIPMTSPARLMTSHATLMTSQTTPMTTQTKPMTSQIILMKAQTNPMTSQTKLMRSPMTSQIIPMTLQSKLKLMTSQTIPMTSQVIPMISPARPIASQATLMTSQTIPMTSPARPIASQATLMTSQTIPMTSPARPIASQATLMTSQTTPITTQTNPMTSRTIPMTSQTRLMTSQTTPMTSQLIRMTPQNKLMTSQIILMTSQAKLMRSPVSAKVGVATAALRAITQPSDASLANQLPARLSSSSILKAPPSPAHTATPTPPTILTLPIGLSLAPPLSVSTNELRLQGCEESGTSESGRSHLVSAPLTAGPEVESESRIQLRSRAVKRQKEGDPEGVTQDRKRLRKPSLKLQEHQESSKRKEMIKTRRGRSRLTPLPAPPSAPPVLVLVHPQQAPPPGVQTVVAPPPAPLWPLHKHVPIVPRPLTLPSVSSFPCRPHPPIQEVPPPHVDLSDWSLLFLKPHAGIQDWLSGSGGVAYLPPSVCTLRAFRELLHTRKALIATSKQLLRGQDSCQSSLTPGANHRADPSPAPDEDQQEAELMAALRPILRERFSADPAYRALKNHFLSCFTVPAFCATIEPIRNQPEQLEEEELQELEEPEEILVSV